MSELPEGLVGIGGPLNADRLVREYRRGVFPWYTADQPVLWWCPDPRMVFDRCEVHVSRSLRRTLARGAFTYSLDTAFTRVIEGCAAPREPDGGTWITEDMKDAYTALHRRGLAHSVETWRDGRLVGGLYGVALGRVFFGESMFSRETDASKCALIVLAAHLRDRGFTMIDGQLPNPHLARLGATEMRRKAFLMRIEAEAAPPDPAGRWTLR